ncbi:hypothetical protein AB1Y20_012597 [Prymnesium parvum]|uniref:Uncharacterized protein n=1 Tax=Prymnesium parvum TaxID=97485 RepID=A0AB34IJ56_PRYPA
MSGSIRRPCVAALASHTRSRERVRCVRTWRTAELCQLTLEERGPRMMQARLPPAATRCDSARGAAGRMSQFSNASIVTVPMVEILKKQEPTSNVYRRNTACWMRRKNTA